MLSLFWKVHEEEKKESQELLHQHREEQEEKLRQLTEKMEASTVAYTDMLERSRHIIKTPLPKFHGDPSEFYEWKQNFQFCLTANDWTDEDRILEMLSGCLFAHAWSIYKSLNKKDKESLESVFDAFQRILDPNRGPKNRELFLKAK